MQHSTKLNESLLATNYMPRSRINKILEQATRYKMVYVIAGAGYGKTQAVHQYIEQQQDTIVRWIQLTENDNVNSRFWENVTYSISLDNKELARKLREIGFPETLAQFKQFADILKNTEPPSTKRFIVFDDFHLINSNQILIFAERYTELQIPGLCIIILSRKKPEINAVSSVTKKNISIITEDELRFTDDEIADFFKWRNISASTNNLTRFSEATKGWALAVQMLSLIVKRMPNNVDFAIDTMKQNIFNLLETEVFNDFTEDIKKKIVQFSLTSNLPLMLWNEISNDILFISHNPQLTSFVWYDNFINNYRIHPLYLEFLQSKQDIL